MRSGRRPRTNCRRKRAKGLQALTKGAASARRVQQLENAAQEWRSALIDISGNNRLLFFKPTAATLDLADAVRLVIAEMLGGSTVRLSRMFADPLRVLAAQRACKALAAKQREAQEEYGVAVAFCAFGLATWPRTQNPNDAISQAEADPTIVAPMGELAPIRSGDAVLKNGRGKALNAPAAPVLLRAVELTHRPGSVDAWELTLTGEAQLNPVLVHVLGAEGVRLNEEEVLDAGDETRGELTPILDYVREACADIAGFRIDERTLLGAFSYLKQPMVADCEDIEALLSSDLVAALAGDEDAITAVRALVGSVSEADPDYKPVESEFLIRDADASQSFVVNAALAGRSLVVQGPPGTGKSQTIANVIAGLVADGKRVLFVAQKRAAITAVLDRLDDVGLGQITLDLFAAGASRRYVAKELGEVLDRQATVGAPITGALHQALTGSRDRLVSHRDALHITRHAWGVTVAQLLAMSCTIPATAATSVRLPSATLASWGPDELEALAGTLGELAGKGGLEPDRLTRTGWSSATLVSNELVAAANETLIIVSSQLLPTASDAIEALAIEFGIPAPATLPLAAALLSSLAEGAFLAQTVPGALDPALDPVGLERLLAATDKSYRKSNNIRLGWGERRKARRDAQAALATHDGSRGPDAAGIHQLLLRAKAARDSWVRSRGHGAVRVLTSLAAAQAAFESLVKGLADLQPYLQNIQLDDVNLNELPGLLAGLADDRSRAQLPRLHELEMTLNAAGLSQVLVGFRRPTGLEHADVVSNPTAAADMLRHIAVHSALDQALTTDPALARVSGTELDVASETFQRTDDEHLKANAARVRRAAAVHLSEALNDNPMQHLLVKKEVTKRRNLMPVRRLFEEAPDVMTAVKPCWAMSPLQVSRLLPATACFDVVIFDEASQVKPADAIPALIRAPQAIVAGDNWQLPPTEFFTKVLDEVADSSAPGVSTKATEQDALAAEAAAEDAELGVPQEVTVPTRPVGESYTRDAESILSAFDRILAGQSRRLLWHYRSRDERLIAVSNTYVYDRSLTTFPAADGNDCLRHEVIPPSIGIKGGTNSPEAEVQRVVSLVVEHARSHSDETLGVITFGVAHARRIDAAVEVAFAAEPDLEQSLNAKEREPFFVKSIERVQGDERDSVILSVGYGKSADGRLRMFWGPLLTPGGERRLNVAISRARARMTLVTSFAADDVAEDTHSSTGFALMFQFLRFMASGGTELSGDGRRDIPLNAFEIDIRNRLTAAGLDLVPQLGVGSYRLDFAARHPEHPGRYVLAIEADGAAYHSGHVARERDRLRQRLLESRGWTFHRIWSTDWFNDANTEVARTVTAFEAAVRASDAHGEEDSRDKTPNTSNPPGEGTSDNAASWHIADARRTLPRPPLVPGQSIDKYDPVGLVKLVRYVRSDGVLRTRDQELLVIMSELGFVKRGHRIVTILAAAQDEAG
jgi:very-short-patch-repair endonuclease